MTRLHVKGWSTFQHYKDRSPAWVKLHRSILDDFDFAMLPLASKALAPMIWLLASESEDGSIDADPRRLAFRLRWDVADIEAGLKPLILAGFLIDASGALAERYQDASLERETYREEKEKEDTSLRSVSGAKDAQKAKSEKFNPRKALLFLGCSERSADSWLEARKAKRAPLTEVALEKLKTEAGKAGLSIADAVQICAERSWQSFQADWKFDRPKSATDPPVAAAQQVFVVENTKAWDAWCAEYLSRGKGYPPCKDSRDHGFKRGWWFPSEYPQESNPNSEAA